MPRRKNKKRVIGRLSCESDESRSQCLAISIANTDRLGLWKRMTDVVGLYTQSTWSDRNISAGHALAAEVQEDEHAGKIGSEE